MNRGGPASAALPHSELVQHELNELADLLRAGTISSRELVTAYIERIEADRDGDDLNAFITLPSERALADAARADNDHAHGHHQGPLHGIPIAVKDNMDTAGIRTTNGMRVLAGWVPGTDAAAVRALRAAGGIGLGKTNMHEGSVGITSVNPHFGAVRNPHSPGHIAGGSSGGSAAAVAASLAPAALGTDTGGSVRIPAALCGVVGARPSSGAVDGAGTFRLSRSFDTAGPITRTTADAALLDAILRGRRQPERQPSPTPDSLRLGVPQALFTEDNAPEVDELIAASKERLTAAGVRLVPVTVAGAEDAAAAGLRMVAAEQVAMTEQYFRTMTPPVQLHDVLDQLGTDVRAGLEAEIGPDALPVPANVYTRDAFITVPAVRDAFHDALSGLDALLTPSTPAPAAGLDEHTVMRHNGRVVSTFETFVRYTFCISVAGIPAITVPAGSTTDGLPLGLQLIGGHGDDHKLTRVAATVEAVLRGATHDHRGCG